MQNTESIELLQQALTLVLLLSAPPVLVAAIVGITIALLQAVTQLQEQSFQYAAKLFAVVATLFVMGSFLGGTLYQFADQVMSQFYNMARRG
jgi:type III secretion protein S